MFATSGRVENNHAIRRSMGEVVLFTKRGNMGDLDLGFCPRKEVATSLRKEKMNWLWHDLA